MCKPPENQQREPDPVIEVGHAAGQAVAESLLGVLDEAVGADRGGDETEGDEPPAESLAAEEEILRAHIKNWGALDLKQRRVVLNMINARRARDAKSAFTREINLLAQKIAYENKGMAKLNG